MVRVVAEVDAPEEVALLANGVQFLLLGRAVEEYGGVVSEYTGKNLR